MGLAGGSAPCDPPIPRRRMVGLVGPSPTSTHPPVATGLTFAENPYDIERYAAIRTIAAEMIARGMGADAGRVLDLFACDAGYATPKVDVRGVVFQGGKILLVQERSDGLWTLPGGWADVGDSPADAVVREIREESASRPEPRSCSPSWIATGTGTRPT